MRDANGSPCFSVEVDDAEPEHDEIEDEEANAQQAGRVALKRTRHCQEAVESS